MAPTLRLACFSEMRILECWTGGEICSPANSRDEEGWPRWGHAARCKRPSQEGTQIWLQMHDTRLGSRLTQCFEQQGGGSHMLQCRLKNVKQDTVSRICNIPYKLGFMNSGVIWESIPRCVTGSWRRSLARIAMRVSRW